MYYLKKAKELGLELTILFNLKVFAVQPNFVIKSIALGLHSLVVGLLLKL